MADSDLDSGLDDDLDQSSQADITEEPPATDELADPLDAVAAAPEDAGEPKPPGEELFGDVVEEPRRPIDFAGDPTPATQDVHLRDSVAGIYEMVKDLEVQLNHMISINEAAERDLEAARRRNREIESERLELLRMLDRAKADARDSAELREELRHMTRENERHGERERELLSEAEKWRTERDTLTAQLDQTKRQRDDAFEEVECLESQLGQLSDYIDKLRAELASSQEAAQQQTRKTELVEHRTQLLQEERDALRQELNESRAALEEIRRSILDSNRQSQTSYYGG